MTRVFLVVVTLVCASYAGDLKACVSAQGYTASSADTIGISKGTGWEGRTDPPVAAAINMWAGVCGGELGTNLPTLIHGSNGAVNVQVRFNPGTSNPRPNGGCAYFNATLNSYNQITGGFIEVYQYASGNAYDCAGQLVPSALDNLIAHEIGHVLGLANSGCDGYVMGPDYFNDAPTSAECTGADDCWGTGFENELSSCDNACPVPCTGNPPVCDTSAGPGDPPPCGEGGPCSPLILDLDGNGITTTATANGVQFDISSDGQLDVTGWTTPGAADALLYYDLNDNGTVDGGHELFGEMTLLPDGMRAANGFEALAARDANGDGVISPRDAIWGQLRLWIDSNHDGAMTRNENFTLATWGVTEMSVRYVTVAYDDCIDAAGNYHRHQGTFNQRADEAGGGEVTRRMVDVYFRAAVKR